VFSINPNRTYPRADANMGKPSARHADQPTLLTSVFAALRPNAPTRQRWPDVERLIEKKLSEKAKAAEEKAKRDAARPAPAAKQ
jgi:hypothetical protein